ncbi:MAG: hypothetical protein U9N55_09970 [candidate division Zixibacteria bacterium]|nr:hypothetical protein [candidate division Zixibacteria bacterium]
MKKVPTKVIGLVVVAGSIFAPNVGALTTACERFSTSAGPGTYDSVYWALQCLASSMAGFLEVAGF